MKRLTLFTFLFLNYLVGYGQIPNTGDPLINHAAWGYDNSEEVTPNNRNSYVIQRHNGLSFSAHSYYGGIRFYNQEEGTPYGYNGTLAMSITDGRVGIGVKSPQNHLHVNGSTRIDDALYLNDASNNGGDKWGIYGWKNSLQLTHRNSDWGYDFVGINIENNGFVGIGTLSPAYKLDVIGTIRAREIKVDLKGADFVFERDYKLMPLNELEEFVKQQKHLPEIASAIEMEENGVDLGNLNSKFLQKIEELTLYIIEQNKIQEKQNEEIQALKERIKALKIN